MRTIVAIIVAILILILLIAMYANNDVIVRRTIGFLIGFVVSAVLNPVSKKKVC